MSKSSATQKAKRAKRAMKSEAPGTKAEAPSVKSETPVFDVEAFIFELDGMGMKLTAVALADGKVLVSRWSMMNANENAEQIKDLWARQIGDDQERIDALAAHLTKMTPGRCISSGLPHVSSPDTATGSESD
jgi:hypothetical protein